MSQTTMTFEAAIRSKFGKTLPKIPEDYAMRKFCGTGFILRVPGGGVFGDWEQGIAWIWPSMEQFSVSPENECKTGKIDLAFEQLVINCGIGLIERGDKLDDADLVRLGRALDNVRRANVG